MMRGNPLSDKRRFFLEEQYARRFKLDEDSLVDVSEETIAARQAELGQLLDWLDAADPSFGGKYAMWIAKLHKKQTIRFPEDIEKINTRLQTFDKVKRTLPAEKRDINRYKTYGELARTLDEHSGVGVREAARIATAEGQEVILEDEIKKLGLNLAVIKVTTQEAATKLARHTDWCVKDPSWGRQYLEWGPLYFIDELSLPEEGGGFTQGRYVLAWRGICNKRYEQYDKFKEFIENSKRKKLCYYCQKPRGRCRSAHPISSRDFLNSYRDFEDGFNYTFTEEDLFEHEGLTEGARKSKINSLPEHLKEFISGSKCEEWYSILNTYDDELSESEFDQIRPILSLLFQPEVSTATRKDLTSYRSAILRETRNDSLEKDLLEHGDASKIVDYIKGPSASGHDLEPTRWRAAEKIIFKDAANAARYYAIIQDTLTDKDREELRKLGERIPAGTRPTKPSLQTSPSDDTGYIEGGFDYKQTRARERIREIRKQLSAARKTMRGKVARIETRRGIKYDKLQAGADKALKDAESGKPIEKVVAALWKLGRDYYGWNFTDMKPQDNSLKKFIVDLIAYYNKGFVRGSKREWDKRRRGRGKGRRRRAGVKLIPHLYSGDDFAMEGPSIFHTTTKRAGYHSRKRKRLKDKLAKLANYANRKVSARARRRRRRNPRKKHRSRRSYRRNSAYDDPHYHSGQKVIVVNDVEVVLTGHFQRRWKERVGGKIALPLYKIVKTLERAKRGRYRVIITVKGPNYSGLAWLMVIKKTNSYVIKTLTTSPLHGREPFIKVRRRA